MEHRWAQIFLPMGKDENKWTQIICPHLPLPQYLFVLLKEEAN